jgi:hypothetical protein
MNAMNECNGMDEFRVCISDGGLALAFLVTLVLEDQAMNNGAFVGEKYKGSSLLSISRAYNYKI